MPGRLVHIAINADDDGATRTFYESVFDWSFADWGPPGFSRAELGDSPSTVAAVQGRRDLVPGVRATGPEVTIEVDDLTGALRRVDAAGGRVVFERSTIPGVGDLAFVADPSDNVVGIIEYVAHQEH